MHAVPLFLVVLTLVTMSTYPGSAQPYSKDTAWRALQFCKASYCADDFIHSWSCGDACNTIGTFNVTGVYTPSGTEVRGYVGVDHGKKEIVAAFRGSVNVQNWILNILFIQTNYPPCNGCKVHSGFYYGYTSLLVDVQRDIFNLLAANPDYSIFVTGHSLGAAVATLCAADVAQRLKANGQNSTVVRLYTLESPRVGNGAFSDFLGSLFFSGGNEHYRITHGGDPVIHLPPILFGYKHVPSEVFYKTADSIDSPYTLCNDIGTDEDTNCSRTELGVDIDDHTNIFGTCTSCGCASSFDVVDSPITPEMKALFELYHELEVLAAAEAGKKIKT